MSTARVAPRPVAAADVIALAKPRIMAMSLLTAAGGLSLAPGSAGALTWLVLLGGTGLIVGAANTLNMYLERDIDCMMSRTKDRPLPAGRLDPQLALVIGVVQAFAAVPLLTFGLNPLTGTLAVVALLSYVMLYTPLKQRTTASTVVGAVPALMGWTAATGSIDAGGLAVFGLLFLWQMPHFYAIALFRHKEYGRAGLKTLAGVHGPQVTARHIVLWLVPQVAVSVAPYYLGIAGLPYLIVAALSGAAYLAYGVVGLRAPTPRWAKRFFLASIAYLPVLFLVLVINGQL
jgi:heme o synthase